MVDFKLDTTRAYSGLYIGDLREYFKESIFLALDKLEMDLGWVSMAQVGSEEVRTSRWTPRQRLSGTTGGTSGSTSMSLKLSDSCRKN